MYLNILHDNDKLQFRQLQAPLRCLETMSLANHCQHRIVQATMILRHQVFQSSSPCKFHVSLICHGSASDEIRWPNSSNPTPYEIFDLPSTATPAEIKKRYYELAKLYHPDSCAASAEAQQERLQRFRQVVQANELLSTARKRHMYDRHGYGWSDMNVNDIMGDPSHWKGEYEGKFGAAKESQRTADGNFEGFFNGNRAQPYYTSNGNFAGGIVVIMVLIGVLQFSHIQSSTQRASDRRLVHHQRASLNLRDARSHAKMFGRRHMIEAFQQRRDVKSGIYHKEDLGK
jgi:curved DNA-binding protein CbpA